MATYVGLVNFTDQGILDYTDSPKRAKAFKEMVEAMGGTLKEMVWTMGAYDVVAKSQATRDPLKRWAGELWPGWLSPDTR